MTSPASIIIETEHYRIIKEGYVYDLEQKFGDFWRTKNCYKNPFIQEFGASLEAFKEIKGHLEKDLPQSFTSVFNVTRVDRQR